MLAVSGRGAGLLGARGGWAEHERTGGEKGDGPRRERERAGPPEVGPGRSRLGCWVGLGFELGFLFWVWVSFPFPF